jgi:Na+-transporting NADH:ubiquinone oxidoreductase subunit NqrB
MLGKINLFKLVLYHLMLLLGSAVVLSALKVLPYPPLSIITSTLVLLVFCVVTNALCVRIFAARSKPESVYITALILALIIDPAEGWSGYAFLSAAAILAMASKYVLAIGKKHIFNPAAIAVVITSFALGESASWWVGNLYMTPLVLMGGILIIAKLKRADMVWSFVTLANIVVAAYGLSNGLELPEMSDMLAFHSALFFLAFLMLTDPPTAPRTKTAQLVYGALVGILFAPQIHIGSVYSTPELALLVGNIFPYAANYKKSTHRFRILLLQNVTLPKFETEFLYA